MKPTLKNINNRLESITYYRKYYILHDFSGVMPEHAEYLGTVIAEYNPDTHECTGIYDYATGNAKPKRHYYMINCVDITDTIESWMRYRISRDQAVQEIQTAIINDTRRE